MINQVIPTIGSKGSYILRAPFDVLVVAGEVYTCQAIRRISDYLANNEDVKKDVYTKYQLTEDVYDAHAKVNMAIASLQSAAGHWLYVPASHVVTYPLTNGVPYRSTMIGVSLPSLPADRDISFLLTQFRDIVTDSLGVSCIVKQVETSRTVLVTKTVHDLKQSERDAVRNGSTTDRSRYMETLNALQLAHVKIASLEQYIMDNHVTV